MPQVHVIGEVVGALGFPKNRLYGRYKLLCNAEHWHVMRGADESYTHLDETSGPGTAVWNHPIDVHFGTDSLSGWPRMLVEVWSVDNCDRSELSRVLAPLDACSGIRHVLRALVARKLRHRLCHLGPSRNPGGPTVCGLAWSPAASPRGGDSCVGSRPLRAANGNAGLGAVPSRGSLVRICGEKRSHGEGLLNIFF
ncbi:unnamed protein product [Ascophyllum nodosum]